MTERSGRPPGVLAPNGWRYRKTRWGVEAYAPDWQPGQPPTWELRAASTPRVAPPRGRGRPIETRDALRNIVIAQRIDALIAGGLSERAACVKLVREWPRGNKDTAERVREVRRLWSPCNPKNDSPPR